MRPHTLWALSWHTMLRQAGKQPRPIPPMNDYNIIKAKWCEVSREPRSMQKLCGTGAGQSVPHCPALSRDVRFCRESCAGQVRDSTVPHCPALSRNVRFAEKAVRDRRGTVCPALSRAVPRCSFLQRKLFLQCHQNEFCAWPFQFHLSFFLQKCSVQSCPPR